MKIGSVILNHTPTTVFKGDYPLIKWVIPCMAI
jgi:hypothetical protein